MIQIEKKTKKPKKKQDPYYSLKFNYMTGDANGDTSKEVEISVKNPYLERFVTLINKLKPTKGTWGIVLDRYNFSKFLAEKQLNQEEYDFLYRLMFELDEEEDEEGYESTFKVNKEDEDYADEFNNGVQGDTDYSFLVFLGVELSYVDEYGKSWKTKIKKTSK